MQLIFREKNYGWAAEADLEMFHGGGAKLSLYLGLS